MTADRAFKQAVQARMARTGERYSTARRHLLLQMGVNAMPTAFEQVIVERLVNVPVGEEHQGLPNPITGEPLPRRDHQPAVLMRARGDHAHTALIYIGDVEAFAIHTAMQQLELPRPMTHDLLIKTISRLGTATRIEIELREGTYYATIEVESAGSDVTTLDARPSDAIAVALRCDPRPSLWMRGDDLRSLDIDSDELGNWPPGSSLPVS